MRGDEQRVVEGFVRWLRREGWDVQQEVRFADVRGHRDGEYLVGEAKGKTTEPGTDVDTLYGQLLRRIEAVDEMHRYAVIVPSTGVTAALRVQDGVRRILNIDVYEVDDSGQVHRW